MGIVKFCYAVVTRPVDVCYDRGGILFREITSDLELIVLRSMADQKKANVIRALMAKGFIKKYLVDGYAAYDSDELAVYRKNSRKGRPIKNPESYIIVNKQDEE